MKVFLDTNILIDYLGKRANFWQEAAHIFELGFQEKLTLLEVLSPSHFLERKILSITESHLTAFNRVCS